MDILTILVDTGLGNQLVAIIAIVLTIGTVYLQQVLKKLTDKISKGDEEKKAMQKSACDVCTYSDKVQEFVNVYNAANSDGKLSIEEKAALYDEVGPMVIELNEHVDTFLSTATGDGDA